MAKLEVTKDFQTFVDGVCMENYNEVYDFHQVASGNAEGQCTYSIEPCPGSDDVLIIYKSSQIALRLSQKALAYLPDWIEQNLMNGLDAESYWGMEYEKGKD